MSPLAWIGFLAAAAGGAVARFVLDGWVQGRVGRAFPWGTFTVNVTGCFLLGVLTGLGLSSDVSATTRTVLGTGGLGAYTTFSSFSYETVRLVEDGAGRAAAANVAASFLVGLAAAAAGLVLTGVG